MPSFARLLCSRMLYHGAITPQRLLWIWTDCWGAELCKFFETSERGVVSLDIGIIFFYNCTQYCWQYPTSDYITGHINGFIGLCFFLNPGNMTSYIGNLLKKNMRLAVINLKANMINYYFFFRLRQTFICPVMSSEVRYVQQYEVYH